MEATVLTERSEVDAIESSLSECEAELTSARVLLQDAKEALADGTGPVEAFGAASGRVAALEARRGVLDARLEAARDQEAESESAGRSRVIAERAASIALHSSQLLDEFEQLRSEIPAKLRRAAEVRTELSGCVAEMVDLERETAPDTLLTAIRVPGVEPDGLGCDANGNPWAAWAPEASEVGKHSRRPDPAADKFAREIEMIVVEIQKQGRI